MKRRLWQGMVAQGELNPRRYSGVTRGKVEISARDLLFAHWRGRDSILDKSIL